jgi:hypothetical protein
MILDRYSSFMGAFLHTVYFAGNLVGDCFEIFTNLKGQCHEMSISFESLNIVASEFPCLGWVDVL